jgi:hypothetical protein
MSLIASRNVTNCVNLQNIEISTLNAEALVREFKYDGIRIPDPDLTVEQVRDLL